MKTVCNISAVAVLLVALPGVCFALWDVDVVTKERAKELGMEVRLTAVGPKHMKVAVEFGAEGTLKNFTEVEMIFRQEDKPALHAALREDRSKPGRVAVSFTADAAQLDKFTLYLRVSFRDGGAGGTIHEIRVKDFVEVKKNP